MLLDWFVAALQVLADNVTTASSADTNNILPSDAKIYGDLFFAVKAKYWGNPQRQLHVEFSPEVLPVSPYSIRSIKQTLRRTDFRPGPQQNSQETLAVKVRNVFALSGSPLAADPISASISKEHEYVVNLPKYPSGYSGAKQPAEDSAPGVEWRMKVPRGWFFKVPHEAELALAPIFIADWCAYCSLIKRMQH